MRYRHRSFGISAALVALLLGGCGLKGDLFLPPEPETPEPVEAPEPPAPGTDEEREEENEDG